MTLTLCAVVAILLLIRMYQVGAISRNAFDSQRVFAFLFGGAPLVIVAPGIVLPAAIFHSRRKRLSLLKHCCHQCFYNLTGNTSGVCPECRMAVQKAD